MSLLYDREGCRKYLTIAERAAFLRAVETMAPEVRTFCKLLAYTGARISEVLAVTTARVDFGAHLIIFESLKKRRQKKFRAVPIPSELLSELDDVHHLKKAQQGSFAAQRLWPWGRTTAWMCVKEGMEIARVKGPQATPKGLRHSVGVTSLQAGVPITLVKKWLGHARLSTTEIYVDAVGDEEQAIASRLWKTLRDS